MLEKPMIDVLGWIGAAALLLGYWLISRGRVTGLTRSYQLLNAGASVLLFVNTFMYRAYPSAFVNLAWLGIAMHTLVRIRRPEAAG